MLTKSLYCSCEENNCNNNDKSTHNLLHLSTKHHSTYWLIKLELRQYLYIIYESAINYILIILFKKFSFLFL